MNSISNYSAGGMKDWTKGKSGEHSGAANGESYMKAYSNKGGAESIIASVVFITALKTEFAAYWTTSVNSTFPSSKSLPDSYNFGNIVAIWCELNANSKIFYIK